MLIFARAITYAILFVGLVLVFLPARLLSWSRISRPEVLGPLQIGGMLIGAVGAALALWCVLTFVGVGKGTPAPFDPPRRLVVVGPYRFVRNPMYVGAGLALAGAALFYQSFPLLGYVGLLGLVTHLFVVLYEEPTLKRNFGKQYFEYTQTVGRWWPMTKQSALLTAALLLGGLITYVDARPNWDDTGVEVVVLFVTAGIFGFLEPRRAWLWALALGIWIPLLGILRFHNAGTLVALVVTFAGAFGGMAVRRHLLPIRK